jgi:hypothetical protein
MQTVISRNARSQADDARRRCRRLAAAGLLGTTFLVGAATSVALAAVADEDMVDITGFTAVGDQSLDNLRGGFSFGPFNVNFGLVIKTAINQQQVLMTSFKVETIGKYYDVKYDWQSYLHDNTPGGSSAGASQAAQTSGGAAAGTQAPDLSDVQEQVSALNETDVTDEATQQAAEQAAQQTAQQAAEQAAAAAQQAAGAAQQTAATAQQAAEAAQQAATEGTTPPADQTAADTSGNDTGNPDIGNPDFGVFAVTEIENGVLIDNGQGTAIMQQFNNGLVTEIINAANGAQIAHSTELNVFVTNFSDVIGRASLFQATNNLALQAVRNNPLLGQ